MKERTLSEKKQCCVCVYAHTPLHTQLRAMKSLFSRMEAFVLLRKKGR